MNVEGQELEWEKLDRIVSRDIQRRRRNRNLFLSMLLLTAAAIAAVMIYGKSELRVLGDNLATDTRLTEQIAQSVAKDAEFVGELSSSDLIREAIQDEANSVIDDRVLSQAFQSSENFAGLIDRSVKASVADFSLQPEFQAMVEDAAIAVPEDINLKIAANMAAIERLDQLVRLQSSVAPIDARKIEAIELRQDALEAELAKLRDGHEALIRSIGDLRSDITLMNERLEDGSERTRDLGPSNLEKMRHYVPRSYVVKESASTDLHDLGLSVRLGQLRDRQIETVIILDSRSGELVSELHDVRVGEKFTFADTKGDHFEALFSFVQDRLLAREYIGLEVLQLFESKQ